MMLIVNGREQELAPGATVAAALEASGAPAEGRGVAVAVDGEVVPRGAWDRTLLSAGQRVEVLQAVGGG